MDFVVSEASKAAQFFFGRESAACFFSAKAIVHANFTQEMISRIPRVSKHFSQKWYVNSSRVIFPTRNKNREHHKALELPRAKRTNSLKKYWICVLNDGFLFRNTFLCYVSIISRKH